MDNLLFAIYDFSEGSVWVNPKCPNCGRFIGMGEITSWIWNYHLEFKNFKCSKCGEIKPDYYWE